MAKRREAMHVIIGTLFIVFLSSCATTTDDRRAGGAYGKDQVAAATAAWVAAYNSRDPARITAQYDPQAVFWGTTSKTVRANPEAIAEYFKDAGKRPQSRVALGEQHIRVYGDIAINTGYYTFSGVRDGKAVSSPARYTMVFHHKNGKWVLVDHHSSRLP